MHECYANNRMHGLIRLIDIQTSKQLIQMDINKMIKGNVITYNKKPNHLEFTESIKQGISKSQTT